MTVLDAIAYAVNVENQGTSLEGDHASGVGTLAVTSVYNFPAVGSVDVNGDVYAYTAIDEDANTVTLSGVTSVAYDDGASVELSPAQPVWYATVVAGSDQPGFNAMVPIHMVPFLAEGFWDEGIPVRIESIQAGEYEWKVIDVPGQQPVYDARSAPIVVTTDDGESVRIDGDGINTFTDDPVPVWTRSRTSGSSDAVASDDDFVYSTATAGGYIRKYDADTGAEDTSGFPIATGAFSWLATDGTYIYARNAAFDIAKYDAATGVENTSGFPIVGSFSWLATDGTFIYAINAGNIRKYDAATGVENTSGFPIVGSFADVATDGTHVYATNASLDIAKYDAATGVENTSGFPIVGSFHSVTTDGQYVYAVDDVADCIRKFEVDTGVEVAANGFPVFGAFNGLASGGTSYLTAITGFNIHQMNRGSRYQSVTVDSSAGTASFHAVAVSDLSATGESVFQGPTSLDGPTSAPLLGHSDQKTTASNFTPTSTTNVNITELDMTFSVAGTTDVVWVKVDPEVLINTGGTINAIELLIDGAAQPVQCRNGGAANSRFSGGKTWRITGLAAGSHTIAFQTRNTAGATSATVVGTMTSASYWTST